MEAPNNFVLHCEMSPDGVISASSIPDNQIITLGMIEYIRERYLVQVVRPGFETKVQLASSIAQA
jgi:hypothetical protein